MSEMPFFNHREIQRMMDKVPALREILAQREIFDVIDPITPALVDADAPVENTCYFATADGRIALRIATEAEAKEKFGCGAMTYAEAFLLADLLANLGDIMKAAIDAQAWFVKQRWAIRLMFEAISNSAEISRKDRIKICSLIHDMQKDEENRAEAVEAMKESTSEAARRRSNILRIMGGL